MGTYYIGGTLPLNSKTYVTRAADEELYQQIRNGEFCYVLNARQMGKSSLRVRTMQRLQDNGVVCASIDITELGSQQVTPEKWYGGLVKTLVSRLGLEETFSLRFLTQKLCQWVCELAPNLPAGSEGEWMENLVRTRIIENWEASDDPEHLKTIRNRILSNEQRAAYLLELYQQIRQQGEVVANNSFEEGKLQLSGLVVKQITGTSVRLKVANPIYFEVFNQAWIEEQLEALRPYAEAFRDWVISGGTDESRLLHGKALQDAKYWEAGKNLSYRDQEFLAASEKKEIEVQIAKKKLEAELERERKDSEAAEQRNRVLTQANRKAKRRIRIGAVVMVMAILGATFSVQVAGNQVIKANREARQAQIARQKAEEQVQNVSLLSELAGELNREGNQFQAEQAWKQAALSFEIKDYDLKQAMLLSHIAIAYQQLEQLDKAMEAVSESLEFLDKVEAKDDLNHSILLAQALNIKSRLLVAQGDEAVYFSVNQKAFDILQKLDLDLTGINPALEFSFPEIVKKIYQGVLGSLFNAEEVSQANLEKARQLIESLQLMKLHDFSQMFPLNPNLVKIEEIDQQAAVFYPVKLKGRRAFILHVSGQPLSFYFATESIGTEIHSTKLFREKHPDIKMSFSLEYFLRSLQNTDKLNRYNITEEQFLENQKKGHQEKYNFLIKPIESVLKEHKIKTLVFVTQLSYFDFRYNSIADAYDGTQYLMSMNDTKNTNHGEFMVNFYQELAKPNVSKAEALRRAQVSFINDPELSDPENWANYVLIGDWR